MELFFFSHLVGKRILDHNNEKVATLTDLIVRINPDLGKSEEKYPQVAGLLAHSNGRDLWIEAEKVQSFDGKAFNFCPPPK